MARWVRWNNPTIKPPLGAQIDWSTPITEGLVGCWFFYPGEKYGLGFNGKEQKVGDVYHQTDYIRFTGNGAISIENKNNVFNVDEFSAVIFVRPRIISDDWQGILTKERETNSYKWGGIWLHSDSIVFAFPNVSVSFNDTKNFHQICYTLIRETNLQGYIDGKRQVSTGTTSAFNYSTPLWVGASYQGFEQSHCDVKYLYVFKRILSDLEIEQLYYESYSFFLYPQYWYLVDFGGINSKEYSSLYDILNKNEYNNKYDIQTKTEKNIKYDLLAQNSYVSKYDLLTKKETNVSYDILTKAKYSIIYDILFAKEYNSKYDLLNSLTTSILYNILTKNEYNVIYDILGTTAIEYTIKYDILNSAQTNIVFDILSKKEANIKYDILASRTSNIVYDILAKTLTNIIYDILTKKETTFLYDIINKKETNFKYDILATKSYTSIYNILTKSEYKILYDILSDIIIRPEIVFKLDKQDTIFKVGKINTIFKLK